MRRPPGWFRAALADGTVAKAMRGASSWAEVARALGVTSDALLSAKVRAINEGDVVPELGSAESPVKTATTVPEYRKADKGIEKPIITKRDKWQAVAEFDAQNGAAGTQNGDFLDEILSERPGAAPRVEVVQETITRVEEHRLKKRVRDLEAEKADLVRQLSDGGEYAEVVAEVLARQAETPPPNIAPRERVSGLREGTPLILASDWHIEEEVRPEQVAGRNRYNLEIAAHRMERFFEASMWAIRHQREVYKIRDCIPWWGGDFITNFLHEENPQSNLLSPTEAILFAQTNMIAGIDHWLDDPEIEQFTFMCNDGNHGRLTDKMHSATRTQNSLEVFLYAQLAHHYRNEPRIRFILPTSQFTFLDNVYGRTIRGLHGDVFKYGGGIGGITVPLFKALARWETVKRADLTVLGHYHQRYCLPNVMVNGSLIGYNAYAMGGGFPFEHPVQSMRMLDATRWLGADIPLQVAERDDDEMSRAA